MTIVRAVPDVRSNDLEASRAFYTDVLGFEICMEQGSMVMFCSPTDHQAQVTVNGDGVPLPPGFLLDVGDADRVTDLHECSVHDGVTIVEPLEDKPWGIRRFSLLDPNGTRITVLAHIDPT